MKALVKYALGEENMGIRDVPIPEPQDGDVLLSIKAVGICGTDIHSMRDERVSNLPVVLGHEFVGVVEKTCGDCGDLKVGDWVTGIPACYGCGTCVYCKRGDVSLCQKRGSIGAQRDGAMAEYMTFKAKYCFKIPEEAPNKLYYAAAEPLACAVRGIYQRLDVNEGDLAVVSGPGTIGLFTLQALKSRGARVIVSGVPADRHRLQKALELGADAVVDSPEALEKEVRERSELGADIVCETSGVAASLSACLKVVRVHGNVLQIGVYGGPVTADINMILKKELNFTGTNSTSVSTWDITMDLLNKGAIKLDPLISLMLPLTKWKEGFQAVIDKSAYKVLLIP